MPAEVRAALQGRQGAARARRLQEVTSDRAGTRAAAASSGDCRVPSLRLRAPRDRVTMAVHALRRCARRRSVFVVLLFVRDAEQRAGRRSRLLRLATWQAPLMFVCSSRSRAASRSACSPARCAIARQRREIARCGASCAAATPRRRRASRRATATAADVAGARRAAAPRRHVRWNSSSGGCCRSRRCSSRWAGSPRASTSSTCCASRARCRCRTFAGLNFLLNEQPDKAIESFIEVVKVDPQTIDLHFALGSLFRRQGEIDRAIRMHQNLLDRPDLPAEQARDRDSSSSRRTSIARACSTAPRSSSPSSTARRSSTRRSASCISIYEQEKDWPKAIAVDAAHGGDRQAAVLQGDRATTTASSRRRRCCSRDYAAARSAARRGARRPTAAARARRSCSATCAGAAGQPGEAIAAWKRIEIAESGVPGARRRAHRRRATASSATPAQGIRCCAATSAQYPSLDLLNALFTLTLEQEGPRPPTRSIKDELARNPTLLGLDRLLEAQLLAAPAERRHDLELVKGLVAQHIKRLGMYKCEQLRLSRASSTTGAARAACGGRRTRRGAPRRRTATRSRAATQESEVRNQGSERS